ncbi:hypothetical protein Cgig2_032142 [Carnegiea gigantea]|uniref:Uncharacterized protein n=1 Tax=Carnegiea gigantea TaxID=171969 RepID=A0A9Q1QB11_9CARY|nr:hypothetical protein Cgig2_032142 [Carnegiea gigantea]
MEHCSFFFDFVGRFSRSKGVGVFGNDTKDNKIPVEVWRYYQLTNKPEVGRYLKLIEIPIECIPYWANCGYVGVESHSLSKALAKKVGDLVEQYVKAMEKLKQGLKTAMAISSEGNAYLQVLKQLNMPQIQASLFDENGDIEKLKKLWEILPTAHKIRKPEPLFKELACTWLQPYIFISSLSITLQVLVGNSFSLLGVMVHKS